MAGQNLTIKSFSSSPSTASAGGGSPASSAAPVYYYTVDTGTGVPVQVVASTSPSSAKGGQVIGTASAQTPIQNVISRVTGSGAAFERARAEGSIVNVDTGETSRPVSGGTVVGRLGNVQTAQTILGEAQQRGYGEPTAQGFKFYQQTPEDVQAAVARRIESEGFKVSRSGAMLDYAAFGTAVEKPAYSERFDFSRNLYTYETPQGKFERILEPATAPRSEMYAGRRITAGRSQLAPGTSPYMSVTIGQEQKFLEPQWPIHAERTALIASVLLLCVPKTILTDALRLSAVLSLAVALLR